MANTPLDTATQLAFALNQLVLPAVRGKLCAPVVAAAPAVLDDQTWPVFHLISRFGPLSAARLAHEIGIDRSGVSRNAQRLARQGLVRRSADPNDARAALLSLTEEGRRLATDLDDALANYLHEMMRTWPRGQAGARVEGLRSTIAWTATTGEIPPP